MLATEYQLHPPSTWACLAHTDSGYIFYTTLQYVQSVSTDNVDKYFQHKPRVATTNLFTNGQASLVTVEFPPGSYRLLALARPKPNATASSLFARRTLN